MKLSAVMILALNGLLANSKIDDGLRIRARTMLESGEVHVIDMATLGLALSWGSSDPAICEELKRLSPSALCVK